MAVVIELTDMRRDWADLYAKVRTEMRDVLMSSLHLTQAHAGS
jgi:hypothetical protein